MIELVNLRVFALVMAAVLVALAIGCASEPEVVYVDREIIREVPVEVVVEKEVVKMVVVTATPAPTPAALRPTAQPAARPTPTPAAPNRSVLLFSEFVEGAYTQISALGFAEGIEVKGTHETTWTYPRHQGLIVVVEESITHDPYDLLKSARPFVAAGGSAAIFIGSCTQGMQEGMQFAFAVSCANISDAGGIRVRGMGEQFAPFLGRHFMDLFVKTEIVPGPSGDSRCVAKARTEERTVCTAVQGTLGNGRFILMNAGSLSWASTWFRDTYIQDKDHKEAASALLNWLVEDPDTGSKLDASFDTASVLARFSTHDPSVGEARADAVSEIIAQHRAGSVDSDRVLELLHTIAPELSIDERRRAADELARLSADDQWDENATVEGVFYLATLITGDEPNPQERIEAAHEMVLLYEVGELDSHNALDLMDTIAPGLSINHRRQAAAALARLSADDDWDDADRMAAASEVFRLVTGVPLDAEQRMGATVDLAGVGVKIFDTDDSYSDREIDAATAIIKQSLTGELTSTTLQDILGSGN